MVKIVFSYFDMVILFQCRDSEEEEWEAEAWPETIRLPVRDAMPLRPLHGMEILKVNLQIT